MANDPNRRKSPSQAARNILIGLRGPQSLKPRKRGRRGAAASRANRTKTNRVMGNRIQGRRVPRGRPLRTPKAKSRRDRDSRASKDMASKEKRRRIRKVVEAHPAP